MYFKNTKKILLNLTNVFDHKRKEHKAFNGAKSVLVSLF